MLNTVDRRGSGHTGRRRELFGSTSLGARGVLLP